MTRGQSLSFFLVTKCGKYLRGVKMCHIFKVQISQARGGAAPYHERRAHGVKVCRIWSARVTICHIFRAYISRHIGLGQGKPGGCWPATPRYFATKYQHPSERGQLGRGSRAKNMGHFPRP
jgi:hypothetical protein